ncbi:alpha/beta hydrolase [Pseudomonas cucumis]|uniref:Alpha/beta hydrolase n=1 Tax=Pseudomonas cucumis TaxID=2954082 RepID=A0ABY9ETC1_9PSED|nr:alpha/beta hydrolase [Pseudomonas cucumis]WLG83468.1 alpha/beta hydrolase [Pseudomonas cucumis]
MEVDNPALKDCKTLAVTHDLTCKTDQATKQAQVKVKKVVVFFIGGAGDKEQYYQDVPPHGNVTFAQRQLLARFTEKQQNKVVSVYLSYKDVRGDKDIQKYVLRHLGGDKSVYISVVGHSLGGWNGAHLSTLLKDNGYTVKTLVTLDPVGGGAGVWMISDIYFTTPKPSAEYWVNILASPKTPDISDDVADTGERWIMTSGPNINVPVDTNHRSAGVMFRAKIQGDQSACDLVYERMTRYLES